MRPGFPAPVFCATKTDMDCRNALGRIIIKVVILLSTEYPAAMAGHNAASGPSLLATALMTMNDKLLKRSCSAKGMPVTRMLPVSAFQIRTVFKDNSKGSSIRVITTRDKTTLTACAVMVEIATPATPMVKNAYHDEVQYDIDYAGNGDKQQRKLRVSNSPKQTAGHGICCFGRLSFFL